MAIAVRESLIAAGIPASEAPKYSAHSGKATFLSWCAKFGLSIGTRRLLGGHADPKGQMALEYSRDALAPMMREAEKVLEAIIRGES